MISIIRDYTFIKQLSDNLRRRYEHNKRTENEAVHVSDILPSGCLRKQYYGRKDRTKDVLSEDTIYHYVRGESSERIITELADMGIAQCKIEHKGIVVRPDILRKSQEISPDSFLVVELKDNATLGKRLEPDDYTFKGYLNQLLYYLVITDVEHGILCIKYSTPELIWYERDAQGDHYLKPHNAKVPGIESWAVYLSMDDTLRQELEQEMINRKDLFLEALRTSRVEILPRLRGFQKKLKCRRCSFMERCWSQDSETVEAMQLAGELSVIDKIAEAYTD